MERTRAEIAKFVNMQLHGTQRCLRNKGDHHHYGAQELRELMDFIFGCLPSSVFDEIHTKTPNQLEKMAKEKSDESNKLLGLAAVLRGMGIAD